MHVVLLKQILIYRKYFQNFKQVKTWSNVTYEFEHACQIPYISSMLYAVNEEKGQV